MSQDRFEYEVSREQWEEEMRFDRERENEDFRREQLISLMRKQVESLLENDFLAVSGEMDVRDTLNDLLVDIGRMASSGDYFDDAVEIREYVREVAKDVAIEQMDCKGLLRDGDREWLELETV